MAGASRTYTPSGSDSLTERSGLVHNSKLGGTGTVQTTCNIINAIIGAGILTVPFAFKQAGYGAIIALLVCTAIVWLTALLVGWAIEGAAKLKPDIPDAEWNLSTLAFVAFGPLMKRVVALLVALELWWALESFLVLMSIQVHLLNGAIPKTMGIIFAGFCGIALMTLKMSQFAIVSFLSISCIVIALMPFAALGHHAGESMQKIRHESINVDGMPNAMAIFLYALSGLPCLPNIRASMRDTSQYTVAVHGAFIFGGLYYAAIGLLGYYFFGHQVSESFTSNLEQGLKGPFKFSAQATMLLFAMKIQAAFPLYAEPVLSSLGYSEEARGVGPGKRWLLRVAFATVSVLVAIVTQNSLSNVAEFMGALLTNSTSIIFPCCAYIAIRRKCKEKVAGPILAVLTMIVFFGALFLLMGFKTALGEIVLMLHGRWVLRSHTVV